MVSGYYEEQAREYDNFDTRHESRNAYVQKINELVAKDLVQQNSGWPPSDGSAGTRVVPSDGSVGKINNMLILACGTGRRAIEIKEQTKLDYEITCVEMSKEMCKIAQQRGLNVINAAWLDADLRNGLLFDAVTFLYAFGHIPSEEERKKVLMKVNKHLNIGGHFYFDAFNIKDKNEWGASAVKNYEKFNLSNFDYQKGDVFYKKVDGEQFAFLHYFTEDEIISLLGKTGFELDQMLNIGYVNKSGEVLNAKDEGAFFIKAKKVKHQ